LAIKENRGDVEYKLSVLIDDEQHYVNPNIIEQYCQRPDVLRSFGWRCMFVFAKDWLLQPGKIIETIIERLKEAEVLEASIPAGTALGEENFTVAAEQPSLPDPVSATGAAGKQVLPGFEDVVFEQYIFNDAGSNKFWEAGLQENKLIVRFGRVGTKGQVQVKTFEDTTKAIKEKDKLTREKLAKGYQLAGTN
jgi:predicted DNA-binding WGR domain protein